jgi:hypothetical protein
MPFFLPMQSTPGRSRFLRRAVPDAPAGERSVDALAHWVHTGVHRLCTAGGTTVPGPAPVVRRPASLQVSERFGRENGRYDGRLTDGVGPRVMTLTSNAERRRR